MDILMTHPLLDLFPFIARINNQFSQQNSLLHKTTLVGKINALEIAENLFIFAEETSRQFAKLEEELLNTLLDENQNKTVHEVTSKAQIAIDLLIRNLFERTADVGFLSTDSVIIDFLGGEVDREMMRARLVAYTQKYSVYDDIILCDTEGNVKLAMNPENPVRCSRDPIIAEALSREGYVEQIGPSDLAGSKESALLYAQSVCDGDECLGVLVLSFRFDDEMQRIYTMLNMQDMHAVLLDRSRKILAASKTGMKLPVFTYNIDKPYEYHHGLLGVSRKTTGYQGYHGPQWISAVIQPPIQNVTVNESTDASRLLTLNPKFDEIARKAEDLVEDLSDIIINGELIASKQKVYVLMPVLDNLRNISAALLEIMNNSISNLKSVFIESLFYDAQFSAALAIDIMDRNLYERANDCRWWALAGAFVQELSGEQPDSRRLGEILHAINELYAIYTNLYIYDRQGTIVAASSDETIIGTKANHREDVKKTLQNSNPQYYFVSQYESTDLYGGKPTYIYNASITSGRRVVGGIGIVFDADVEFRQMLQDAFIVDRAGGNLYIDGKGRVIHSAFPSLAPLDRLNIDHVLLQNAQETPSTGFMQLDGAEYIVGVAKSTGYREYKVSDNYTNELYAVTLIKM